MLFRHIKRSFSAYLSLVILISRKVTKDKRLVTDSEHLNIRITKNNLAYPLLKDRDIKGFGKLKKILWNLTIFW